MIEQIVAFVFGEFKRLRHEDAVRRARINAEPAVAAFRKIDVKLRHPEAFLVSCRRFAEVVRRQRLDRVDHDAVHRTGFRALVAADAIVHIDVQPVARTIGNEVFFVRILNGHFFLEHVPERDFHPDHRSPETIFYIFKVRTHKREVLYRVI